MRRNPRRIRVDKLKPRKTHLWIRGLFGLALGIVTLAASFEFWSWFIDLSWLKQALAWATWFLTYFPFIFPHCIVVVPADKAYIMINRALPEVKKLSYNEIGFRDIHAQWEVQSGVYPKFPWDDKKPGEVNMKHVILVESDPGQTYTTLGETTITLKWQIRCTPLPGFIVNFDRTNEDDIRKRVKARAEKFLQGYIGSLTLIKFDKQAIEDLKVAFEEEFGGEEWLDPMEIQLGIWTGSPDAFDIGNVKEVEDAKNFETEMASVKKTVKDFVEDLDINPEAALRFVTQARAASKGKAGLDYVELGGLFAGGQQGGKKKGRN